MYQKRKVIVAVMLAAAMIGAGCSSAPKHASDIPIDQDDSCEIYRKPLRDELKEPRERWLLIVDDSICGDFHYIYYDFIPSSAWTPLYKGFLRRSIILNKVHGHCSCLTSSGERERALIECLLKNTQQSKQAVIQKFLDELNNRWKAYDRPFHPLYLSAKTLQGCRLKQIRAIKLDYIEKKIDRQSAIHQLDDISIKTQGDKVIIDDLLEEDSHVADKFIDVEAEFKETPRTVPVLNTKTISKIIQHPKTIGQKIYTNRIKLYKENKARQDQLDEFKKETYKFIGDFK